MTTEIIRLSIFGRSEIAVLAIAVASIVNVHQDVCGQVIVESTFDTGSENWSVVTLPGEAAFGLDYEPSGGNPGGHIQREDPDGLDFYFEAPDKFLGDQSAAYLGSLTFDIRQSAIQNIDLADAILVGGPLTLVSKEFDTVDTTWKSFVVPLTPDVWFVDKIGETNPTAMQLQNVLTNLEHLRIRGDYVNGLDTS